MIDSLPTLEFDVNGDSQIFVAKDEFALSYSFAVRRIQRKTHMRSNHNVGAEYAFAYWLVSENGNPLSGGMTLDAVRSAVLGRLNANPTPETEDDYDRRTNYRCF